MSGRTDGLPTEDHLELPGYGAAEPLAQGGFSTIYRVHQPQFDRLVAVKVLGFALTDYKAQRRFQRECRLAGRLSAHPNIVTVHDAGIAPDGRPYITMEYLPAGSIADRIRRDGPFKVSDALRIGIACAGALETAHRAGVIHRDVKPANILLTSYGQPALADFGLSVLAERQKMTTSAEALTPYHAPPEMLERSAATPRSDVYSLASSLYTMLAGRAPHQGVDDDEMSAPTVGELLLAILQQDVPPIGRHDIPQALEGALSGALARDPNERTPSAVAFAEALQEVQLQLGYEVTDPIVIDVDTGEAPGSATSGGDRSVSPRSLGVSPSPSVSPSPGPSFDLPDVEIEMGDSFWQPTSGDDQLGDLDDPLGDLGDTTVDRSALLRPLPRPLTRQPTRPEREPADWWKVGALVAAAVVVFLLGLLLMTGGGGGDGEDAAPTDEDVDVTRPTASTVDAGEEDPDPDGESSGSEGGGSGEIREPTDVAVSNTGAGLNLVWEGDPDESYVVWILSEEIEPALIEGIDGTSTLVNEEGIEPDGGHCFFVAYQTEFLAAATDAAATEALSQPACINGANEDSVRTA